MVLIRNFDEAYCTKIKCDRIWIHNGIAVCYGLPEECKKNIRHGYPKEVKDRKQ